MDHLRWWFPMTVHGRSWLPQWVLGDVDLVIGESWWIWWLKKYHQLPPRSLLSPTCPCAKIFRLQREVPGQPHFETKPTVSILRLFSGWNHGSFCRAGPVVLQHLDVAWHGDNDNSSELRHGWAAFEHLFQPWASQIWAFIVSSVTFNPYLQYPLEVPNTLSVQTIEAAFSLFTKWHEDQDRATQKHSLDRWMKKLQVSNNADRKMVHRWLKGSFPASPRLMVEVPRSRKTYLGESITDEDFASSKSLLSWAQQRFPASAVFEFWQTELHVIRTEVRQASVPGRSWELGPGSWATVTEFAMEKGPVMDDLALLTCKIHDEWWFSRAIIIINNQRETGHEEWMKKKYYIPYLLVTQLEWINAYSN